MTHDLSDEQLDELAALLTIDNPCGKCGDAPAEHGEDLCSWCWQVAEREKQRKRLWWTARRSASEAERAAAQAELAFRASLKRRVRRGHYLCPLCSEREADEITGMCLECLAQHDLWLYKQEQVRAA